jgi:hypothetical protein
LSCPACTEAAAVESHQFAAGCRGCVARGLARIFLRRGERGRKLRMACEQAGVTEQQVRQAWAADAANPERPLTKADQEASS